MTYSWNRTPSEALISVYPDNNVGENCLGLPDSKKTLLSTNNQLTLKYVCSYLYTVPKKIQPIRIQEIRVIL